MDTSLNLTPPLSIPAQKEDDGLMVSPTFLLQPIWPRRVVLKDCRTQGKGASTTQAGQSEL